MIKIFIKNNRKIFKREALVIAVFCCLTFFTILGFVNAEEINNVSFSDPSKILINPQTKDLFVLNAGNNQLTIIDDQNYSILSTIYVGEQKPGTMFFGPSGNLYMLFANANKMTVFLQPSFTEVEFIDLGCLPSLYSDADFYISKIFIVCSDRNYISVLDRKNNTQEKFEIGKDLSTTKVNGYNHKVYIMSEKNKALLIFDGIKNKLIKEIPLDIEPPFGLEIGENNKVFITSKTNSSVFIIDGNNDSLITSINTNGNGSFKMAIINSAQKLYISNWFDSSVSVIDTKNYKLIKKIPLSQGDFPGDLTKDVKNNLLFLSISGTDKIAIIDIKKDQIISTFSTGINPRVPVINSEKREAYVPSITSDSITIVSWDSENNFSAKTIPNDKIINTIDSNLMYPLKLAINEKNNEIYVLNNLGGNFLIIDGKTYLTNKKISVGQNPLDMIFSQQLNKIFVSVGDEDKIFIYNVLDGSQKEIKAGDKPSDLFLNNSNNKLYAVNYNDNSLSVIDAVGDNQIINIPLNTKGTQVVTNSAGNKIYIISYIDKEILVINGLKNEISQRIKLEYNPIDFLYDKIQDQIFVRDNAGLDIIIIDCKSDQIKKTLYTENNKISSMYFNEEQNRVYLGTDSGVTILDPVSLELVDNILKDTQELLIGNADDKIIAVNNPNSSLSFVNLKDNKINEISLSQILNYFKNGYSGSIVFKDSVFNETNKKLFIATVFPDSVIVLDTKNNKLDAVISNEGVEINSYVISKTIKVILLGGGIIILVGLLIFVIKKIRNSRVDSEKLVAHS